MKSSEEFIKVILTLYDHNGIVSQIFDNSELSTDKFLQQKQQKDKFILKKMNLNMFGKGITHIKLITEIQLLYLHNIKEIDLSHNALTNIENLKCLPLQELNLSHNKIIDQEQLLNIFIQFKNCPLSINIKRIYLKGNPFAKKTIVPDLKRQLFALYNDLQLFSKGQTEMLESILNKVREKTILQNILTKISLHLDFMNRYDMQIGHEYENLLLLHPEELYKTLRKQFQYKALYQTFGNFKKQFIMTLPVQRFLNISRAGLSKPLFTPLMMELKNQQQNISKIIKSLIPKVQSSTFNLLTMRKMSLQRRARTLPSMLKNESTPIKLLQRFNQPGFPLARTPLNPKFKDSSSILNLQGISTKRQSSYEDVHLGTESTCNLENKQSHRNPFEEIVKEDPLKQKNNSIMNRERTNPRQSSYESPRKKNQSKSVAKYDARNTSKTLFELSQTLLKHPKVGASQQSLNFDFVIEDKQNSINGGSERYIQKMFYPLLVKSNPIYQLLLSPIESLKQTQKVTLIRNLLQNLKQKYKQVNKYEKYKCIYDELQKKNKLIQSSYQQEKLNLYNVLSRVNQFEQKIHNGEIQVEFLSSQLQAKTQENFKLKQEISQLKQDMEKFKNITLNADFQYECEEKIVSKRAVILKRDFLNQFNMRAIKFVKFRKSMKRIQQKKSEMILNSCFDNLKAEVKLAKRQHVLKIQYSRKLFSEFTFTMRVQLDKKHTNMKKQSLFISSLKSMKAINLLCRLYENKQKAQMSEKAYKFHNRKMKQIYLKKLKINCEDERNKYYEKLIYQFKDDSKVRLKAMIFKQWLIWQKEVVHKQIEIRVSYRTILARRVMGNICDFYAEEKLFQAQSIALVVHLNQMRKMNSFHRFYLHVSLERQMWKSKLYKINLFTKGAYLNEFMSSVRAYCLKKKRKNRDHQLTKRKSMLHQLSDGKIKKLFTLINTKKQIRRCYFQSVKNSIFSFKRQVDLQKHVQNNKKMFFLNAFIKRNQIKKQFCLKMTQLKLLTLSKSINEKIYCSRQAQKFFKNYKRKNQLKQRLINFFINKNKNLLTKHFYLMRICCLIQKSEYFSEKLLELGPDIQLIEERQIRTNLEKVSLVRQIEQKNKQVESYEKELREMRMLLEAKQIKYEKLRDIYAETVQLNSREHDIYQLDLGESLEGTLSSKLSQKEKVSNFRPEAYHKRTLSGYQRFSPERDTKLQKPRLSDYLIPKTEDKIQNDRSSRREYNYTQSIPDYYPNFKRF